MKFLKNPVTWVICLSLVAASVFFAKKMFGPKKEDEIKLIKLIIKKLNYCTTSSDCVRSRCGELINYWEKDRVTRLENLLEELSPANSFPCHNQYDRARSCIVGKCVNEETVEQYKKRKSIEFNNQDKIQKKDFYPLPHESPHKKFLEDIKNNENL